MGDKFKIELKGFRNLVKKTHGLSCVDMEGAVKVGAEYVHGQAKELCPVDTGALRASIHMECMKIEDMWKAIIYTNKHYCIYVECGTGKKGEGTYPYEHTLKEELEYRQTPWWYTTDGGKTFHFTRGQRAQPYMYPALERNKKVIMKLMNEELKRIVNQKMK